MSSSTAPAPVVIVRERKGIRQFYAGLDGWGEPWWTASSLQATRFVSPELAAGQLVKIASDGEARVEVAP